MIKLKNKLLIPILVLLLTFSVAYAGQITHKNTNLYFFEDSNEIRMGNEVVGVIAYKNKGLEQNRPTYYESNLFLDDRANEEIYLQEFKNGEWKKVNFAHYTSELNEDENTITKHYWNNMKESMDVIYTIDSFDSPVKLEFKLWGFFGDYRIQWRVSEINTEQVYDKNHDLRYVNPFKNNKSEPTTLSAPVDTIIPPQPVPEEFELSVNYDDLVEAIGYDKVNKTIEYDENGTILATNFILGKFSMVFWDVLELDPQITTGHTTNQVVNSFLKTYNYEIQNTPNSTLSDAGWNNPSYLYDNDWDTYANAGSVNTVLFSYMNYTKPAGVTGATWKVKDVDGNSTLDIPQSCLELQPLQLAVRVLDKTEGTDGGYWICYNSTGTELLKVFYDSVAVYEEEITWEYETYLISIKGDYESGTNDGAYILKTTNFTNDSSWTKAIAMGGESAPRDNLIFTDVNDRLHFIMNDASYRLQERDSSDGTTWTSKAQVIATGTDYLLNVAGNPKVITLPNGLNAFASSDSSSDPRWNTYNATSDTYTVSNAISTATNVNYRMSSFVNEINNETFLTWGYSGADIWVSTGSNLATPTNIFTLTGRTTASSPSIYSYDNNLYLFYSAIVSPARDISYFQCDATGSCNSSGAWSSEQNIPDQYGWDFIYSNVISIENEGIFLFSRTNSTTIHPIYILNNDLWFRIDDLNITLSQPASFDYLNLIYDGEDEILMAYSDVVSGVQEVFADSYTIPDVVVKIVNELNETVRTNQTFNVSCGTTFMKQVSTETGSIAIYPEDYTDSSCSTNSTTITLIENDYEEENLTVTRTSNLEGYLLEADTVGWNVTLKEYGCANTPLNEWDLTATNGTNSYNFTNQNTSIIYTVVDIDLTGNINFTFTKNQSNWLNKNDTTPVISQNTSYFLAETLEEIGGYVTSATVYLQSNQQGQCYVEFFYTDGTSASTVAQVSPPNQNFTFNNINPTKIVTTSELWCKSNVAGKYILEENFSINYNTITLINETIQTTRPANSLTQINEFLPETWTWFAIDRRNTSHPLINNFFLNMDNGTSNLTTQATGYNLSLKTNEIPLGSITYIFVASGYNNTIIQKTVDCSSTGFIKNMESAGLDLSVFDEETQSNLTFNVTLTNSTTQVEFLNQVNGVFWKYTQFPQGAVTLVVTSDGYEGRTYYITNSPTTFTNQSAYLLSNSAGLIRSFTVLNSGYTQLSGATVTISRFIGSIWTVVGEKTTDDSGIATFLMDPSELYQIVATYGGLSSPILTIQPTSSAYTIIIPTGGSVTPYAGFFGEISYFVTPAGLWINSANSTAIYFNVTCYSDDLDYFSMNLTDQNYTQLFYDTVYSSDGGYILASINTSNITRVYGTFSMVRDDGTQRTFTKNWIVQNFAESNVSLFSMLTQFKNIQSDEMGNSAKMLIVLVVATALMGGALSFGLGAFMSGFLGLTLITIAGLFGWFPLSIVAMIWAILIGLIILTRGI